MQDNPHAPNTTTPQAPNPDELGADIQTVATEERKLPVFQPIEKRLEAAEESGRKREEAAQMTADLAAYTKEKKKEITKVEVQAGEFDAIVKTWHKAEHVRVEKRIDWKRGVAYYVRTDTNQIVEGPRALYEHERQRTVDFETPKSDPPASSEAWAALHSEPWDTGTPEYLEDDNDEPEDSACSARPLRERIVEVLTVEDVALTFHELMYKLDLDSDDEEIALEVDNELAAGLSCTPQVYARDEEGAWGLAEWVTENSTVSSALRDDILAVLRVAGDKGMTNTALAKSLGQDIEHIDSELDALKHDGLATGRGGRGKRWHAVTREAE